MKHDFGGLINETNQSRAPSQASALKIKCTAFNYQLQITDRVPLYISQTTPQMGVLFHYDDICRVLNYTRALKSLFEY